MSMLYECIAVRVYPKESHLSILIQILRIGSGQTEKQTKLLYYNEEFDPGSG